MKIYILIILNVINVVYSYHISNYNKNNVNLFQLKSTTLRSSNTIKKQVKKPLLLPDLSQSKFPDVPENGYDLIVIGSGPGGESCAVRAAQLGKRVAIIEKKSTFGGPTGLTSKAVREATKRICRAVDQIGGDRRRQVKGLWRRSFPVLKTEAEVFQAKESRDKLEKSQVDLFVGSCEFAPSDLAAVKLRVCRPSECIEIKGKNVVIATGSRPNRPDKLSPDVILPWKSTNRILTASEIGQIKELPNAVAIIGSGVIAVEYATVLAELGVGVTLICEENQFMSFLDNEIKSKLKSIMKKNHILFIHEKVKEVIVGKNDSIDPLRVVFERRNVPVNNKYSITRELPERKLVVDFILYSGGRDANSRDLGLENVKVNIGKYDRIIVDENYRTCSNNNIYAIGDCIGAGLASIAQKQGRVVAENLFGYIEEDNNSNNNLNINDDIDYNMDDTESDSFFISTDAKVPNNDALFGKTSADIPMTLWTIPELATVGLTYDKLKDKKCDIIQGYGYFKDMARGRLSGEMDGYLKLVAQKKPSDKSHVIVGVEILGEGANELIQLGSVLINSKSTLDQLSRTPFAAVTLSGLYQLAADDALIKLRKR